MSEGKAREFVIIENPGLGSSMRKYRVKHDSESMGSIEAKFRNGAIVNYFKVIEKSAFDSLQKENEALKAKLKDLEAGE